MELKVQKVPQIDFMILSPYMKILGGFFFFAFFEQLRFLTDRAFKFIGLLVNDFYIEYLEVPRLVILKKK